MRRVCPFREIMKPFWGLEARENNPESAPAVRQRRAFPRSRSTTAGKHVPGRRGYVRCARSLVGTLSSRQPTRIASNRRRQLLGSYLSPLRGTSGKGAGTSRPGSHHGHDTFRASLFLPPGAAPFRPILNGWWRLFPRPAWLGPNSEASAPRIDDHRRNRA